MKRITRLQLFSMLLFFNVLSAAAQTHTPKYVSMAGKTKGYYEYLPEGYNPSGSTTYPLILFMTGIGEFGDGSSSQLPRVLKWGIPRLIQAGTFPKSFVANGVTHRFIVITPQFSTTDYPKADDMEAVLNYIVRKYKVNTRRIYITGLSYGGGLSFAFPGNNATYASRIAAIVPIASPLPGPGSQTTGDQIIKTRSRIIAAANLPVWAFHNSGDATEPATTTNSYITYINQSPAPTPLAKKTIFTGTGTNHDAWTKAYNPTYKENNLNVYQWMLQYQRPVPLKKIQVNVYSGSSYGDLAWNNWNVGTAATTAGVSSAAFKYYDGATSTVSATLSATSGMSDNGSAYGNTHYLGSMAAMGVLRHASFSTATSRTLTLKGLSTAKTYTLELYASRNSSMAGSTIFKINTTSKTVSAVNNFTAKVTFTGVKASSTGQIVVTLTKSGTYNYINGFTLIETGTTTTTTTREATISTPEPVIAANEVAEPDASGIGVYPNPASGSVVLRLNNSYSGMVQVQVRDAAGRSRNEFRFVKNQPLLQQSLRLENLQKGVYFITVQMGTRRQTTKISKL